MTVETPGYVPEREPAERRPQVSDQALHGGIDVRAQFLAGYDEGVELMPHTDAQLQLGQDNWLSLKHISGETDGPSLELAGRESDEKGLLVFASTSKRGNTAGPMQDIFIRQGESKIIGQHTVPRLPRTVSRQHVELGVTDDARIWVRDLGSTNGTWLRPYRP